ncbi:MAG: helix-turn-helix transcriptional regulator [Acidobacteriota bacterium]|nr:helix-turn-helix transcriptional regulator [Acidobacteriota bacterium]
MSRTKVQKKNTSSARRRPGVKLVPKELRILKWSAKGYSMGETSARLGMSRHGVDWYWRKILSKLRARSATHAVYKALSQGLIG